MKLSTLLLGAAAIGLLTSSFAMADDYLGGAVKSSTVGGKEILTDTKGMTLYIWDKDAVGTSNCYDKCAQAWPPLLVDAATAVTGDFTLVDRKDSDKKIVAYKGWQEARVYHWQAANRKAREALAETAPAGQPSRGAHALLGEGLYAQGDFHAALDEFSLALAESPRDARLKRRVIRSRRRLQERSPTVAAEPAAEQ